MNYNDYSLTVYDKEIIPRVTNVNEITCCKIISSSIEYGKDASFGITLAGAVRSLDKRQT